MCLPSSIGPNIPCYFRSSSTRILVVRSRPETNHIAQLELSRRFAAAFAVLCSVGFALLLLCSVDLICLIEISTKVGSGTCLICTSRIEYRKEQHSPIAILEHTLDTLCRFPSPWPCAIATGRSDRSCPPLRTATSEPQPSLALCFGISCIHPFSYSEWVHVSLLATYL